MFSWENSLAYICVCVCVYARTVTHWGGLVCLGLYQNVSCGCRRQKLCGIWLGGMRCGWRYVPLLGGREKYRKFIFHCNMEGRKRHLPALSQPCLDVRFFKFIQVIFKCLLFIEMKPLQKIPLLLPSSTSSTFSIYFYTYLYTHRKFKVLFYCGFFHL